MKRKFVNNMKYFVKNQRNVAAMATTTNGVMLKEKAMAIKAQLQNSDFDYFSASDN